MKNRFLGALILLAIVSKNSLAQDSLSQISPQKFVKGIYLNFQEYEQRSPSITDGFRLEMDTGKFDRYKLIQFRKKKITKPYMVCDGVGFYLNAKTYVGRKYFVKVLVNGPILYFEDERGKVSAISGRNTGPMILLGGVVAGAISHGVAESKASQNPGWIIYTPDKTGEPFILDARNLQSILEESDQELLTQFKKENDKSDFSLLLQYVFDYNKKHSMTH